MAGAALAGNVTALFRSENAHSPSQFALSRAAQSARGPLDFCIPCNPYFPTPAMFEELKDSLHEILTYYPSSANTIARELCDVLELNPQTVALGNGSTELITWIDHLLVREALAVPVPTFGRWTDQPMETGKRVDMFPLPEADGFALDPDSYLRFIRARGSRAAVICNPNNPDGGLLPRRSVLALLDALVDLDLVVVDESFLEFADAEDSPSVAKEAVLRPNVIVLRSLGKNFGMHGVRLGYLVAGPALAGRVREALPKWNVNSFAEAVVFMLREHPQEYAQSLQLVRRDRFEMYHLLTSLPGLTVYPSQGNFLFVRLPVGADGVAVRDRLLTEHGILVRECGNKIGSSSRFLRLVVRPQPDVMRLVTGLEQVLHGPGRRAAAPEPYAMYDAGAAAGGHQQGGQGRPRRQDPAAVYGSAPAAAVQGSAPAALYGSAPAAAPAAPAAAAAPAPPAAVYEAVVPSPAQAPYAQEPYVQVPYVQDPYVQAPMPAYEPAPTAGYEPEGAYSSGTAAVDRLVRQF